MLVRREGLGFRTEPGQQGIRCGATDQQFSESLRLTRHDHVLTDQVSVQVRQQRFFNAGNGFNDQRPLVDEDKNVGQNATFDVGQKCLAALPGGKPLDVVCAEVVEERLAVGTCQFDLSTIRHVEQRGVLLSSLKFRFRVTEMEHPRAKEAISLRHSCAFIRDKSAVCQ